MQTGDLNTPALLLDLNSVDHNLMTMARFFETKAAKVRPHFKNHRVLSLAAKQVQAGSVGITCARLEDAERLVQYGITNVLIANEIASENLIRRFVELSQQAPVMVAVDNSKVVSDMARIAGSRVSTLNVLVDLDVGLGRCGVAHSEDAVSLTKAVVEKGLRFRGLMGYAGGIRVETDLERERAADSFLRPLLTAKAAIERAGHVVGIVSCGGTGDYSISGNAPGISEVQAGSYLLMDTLYASFAPEFRLSLSVLTTVISKTENSHIVLDAGLTAVSSEKGKPSVKGHPGLRVQALHAEHTIVEILEPSVSVQIGDRMELWVHYLDPTLCLHGQMYGIREGKVVDILPIEH